MRRVSFGSQLVPHICSGGGPRDRMAALGIGKRGKRRRWHCSCICGFAYSRGPQDVAVAGGSVSGTMPGNLIDAERSTTPAARDRVVS